MAPYLALCKEEAEQRDYPLRAVFNTLRYIVRTGSQWRYMPDDLPPWNVVYQQTQHWIRARCFEIMVEDLRMLLREFAGRKGQPTAMILDSRIRRGGQSTSESGACGVTICASSCRCRTFEAKEMVARTLHCVLLRATRNSRLFSGTTKIGGHKKMGTSC
jgi:transposase